jgi:hypothetical protein
VNVMSGMFEMLSHSIIDSPMDLPGSYRSVKDQSQCLTLLTNL